MTYYERICSITANIKEKTGGFSPRVALVLGSGLGDFAEGIDARYTVRYEELDGFPVSTVLGHAGQFVFGYVGDVPVVIMQGRVHHYEGYVMDDVVLPTRVMGLLGVKALLLTNAAGGVNYDYSAGDFMLITDHISSFVPSPLIGPNIEELGTRFPDMSRIYDPKFNEIIRQCAAKLGATLHEGVYLQLTGPNYESPAEIRALRTLGADAVGMSTACEAMVARHMGLPVCGISCISNLACGMTDQPLTHEEVAETADRVAPVFKALVTESIKSIGEEIS